MNSGRRETAVIIIPDSVAEDDPDKFDGYIGEDAGGHRITFGRHNRCLLNDIPEDYMVYVKREFAKTARSRGMPIFTAVERYTTWLLEYAEQNYGEFIVPFGKKHFGQKIEQCRDKRWFRWILKQPILKRKFPIFCAAIKGHLKNPIHQEVHRDIGELLSATQYADDMELMLYNQKEKDEFTRNVWIAVSDDSDSDDSDSESDNNDGAVLTSRSSTEENEEESAENSEASDSDAYEDDFIDDAELDMDDDHPDMDDDAYYDWLQDNITQSDLLANLGSTYRVGKAGTFANWQPISEPTGSETDLSESDVRSDTTIQDTDEAEPASETSSVTETDSDRDSASPPTTRRKTLCKRKRASSEDDNDGIEDDRDSQFDEGSYEPSQEPSDEEGPAIENSQRKTRSVTKAVAKLTASDRSLANRSKSTTPSVSQETDESEDDLAVERTPLRRAREIASPSSDSDDSRPVQPSTPAKRKHNIFVSSRSDSDSASPATSRKAKKRRVSSTNSAAADSPFTSTTNTPMRDKTMNYSQSSSTTEEVQPRQPPGSARKRAIYRVLSSSGEEDSSVVGEKSVEDLDHDEGQPRSPRKRRRSLYRAPSSENDF